jgi:hypothetical protein
MSEPQAPGGSGRTEAEPGALSEPRARGAECAA